MVRISPSLSQTPLMNMRKTSYLLLLLSLLFFSLLSPCYSSTFPFIYGSCTPIKYDPTSSYEANLNSLFTTFLNSATSSNYNKYAISLPNPSPTLFGLYQCRGDVSIADCAACVRSAVSQLGIFCLDACGGTIQLDGCYIRYDNASFLGAEDKTLVLKKCGPPTGRYDTDMLSRRDEVLTSLSNGNGLYRVGSVGYVSGVAQCMGDLGGGECTDCLAEAVERLRGGCGWSVWGDVYLGKCYARYIVGGIYTPAGTVTAAGEGTHRSSSSSGGRADHQGLVRGWWVGILLGVLAILLNSLV
ncbi:hypothetical protein ACLOJK_023696 [Asimina triloba]